MTASVETPRNLAATGEDAPPENSFRGADILAETLIDSGVTHVFGVPGDTGVVFYDALSMRTERIRHILARDERHAASMADAYARVSGQVGAVEVSSGGGTTYVVGGLGEAFAAGTPVLLITSDIHSSSRGTGALTEIDQRALFSAVTKQSFVPESASEIPQMVRSALDVATSGKPGPVAIILPEDILDEDEQFEATTAHSEGPVPTSVPRSRPAAEPAMVNKAVEALRRAARPALLVGGGAHYSGAYEEIARLAEQVGAPVATTIHGKGAFPEVSPLALGVTGNNGGNAAAIEYLRSADVTVIIGSRANATDTDSYTAPARSGKAIAIDIDPTCVAHNYPDALVLSGDAKTVITQLLEVLSTSEACVARNISGHETGRASAQLSAAEVPEGQLLVNDVMSVLTEVLEPLAPTVVADPGTPTPAVADRWHVTTAGRRTVIPRGHGPMGFAIPGAVGAAIARPEHPVLSLTADGSFAMSCGELETIARLQLPIIMVQFNNNSMGWIKMLQHLYLDGRYFGVDPGPIDSAMVARACGLDATRVTTLDEMHHRVSEAVKKGAPLFLDVEVPHMIDVIPQVSAWHRALDGDATRPVY